jgi:methylenetetrahydrofolate dehydrogenase (NADP+)/methenyltetrahydrofolate cyclohydrolase
MAQHKVIDGKAFAASLTERIGIAVTDFMAAGHPQPGLAVVQVGEDPASQVYVRNKIKTTIETGMRSIEHKLDVKTSQDELLKLIKKLNKDDSIDGILIQLPLPDQINGDAVIDAIDPDKDVDGFHLINVGRLSTGQQSIIPCTPYGCLMLLRDHFGDDLSGKNAVVIGRSNIVGKPMAQLLLGESCTVTIAHSRTKDLPGVCRNADIVIAAVGRPEMVKADWIGEGAVVIDVGINRIPAPERGEGKFRLTGDVDYEDAATKASAITPVPGGVGPMTIACLLRNTLVAAARRRNAEIPSSIG